MVEAGAPSSHRSLSLGLGLAFDSNHTSILFTPPSCSHFHPRTAPQPIPIPKGHG